MRGGGERLVAGGLWLMAAAVAGVFVWIAMDLLMHGFEGLSIGFIFEAPLRSGRAGGVGPIIVSSLLILGVCLAASGPLGMGVALWLTEFTRRGGWSGRLVGWSLDVLAAVPSIVFGLFGNALLCVWLGLGYSILSGGLTLACMVLPIVIRSTEAGLRSAPGEHRRAAAALGLSKWRTAVYVLLPVAAPGLAAGLVLGIGRALAETAALLFTSGYVDRMPGSLFDPGRSLSIHIYDLSMNVSGGEPNAYATALVLMAMLLTINVTAMSVVGRWHKKATAA